MALRLMQDDSGCVWSLVLWLSMNAMYQIYNSTDGFLLICFGSSHCWFYKHSEHQVQALHGHLPGVGVESLPGPAGGQDSRLVASLLAAHPTPVTHFLPH